MLHQTNLNYGILLLAQRLSQSTHVCLKLKWSVTTFFDLKLNLVAFVFHVVLCIFISLSQNSGRYVWKKSLANIPYGSNKTFDGHTLVSSPVKQ